MMYVGETPWHRLGQKLLHPPTAEQAIVAAGLDWRVMKKPVCVMDAGAWYEIPDRYAIVREDLWGKEKCPIFATVSENYVPLQNREAFGFFDGLIDSKVATYETAGALGEGERVWVMAKLKDDLWIAKKDQLERYILLANGHNAATAVRIVLTPIRVVCQNTLNWALKTKNDEFRVYHGPDMHKKLEAARDHLTEVLSQYDTLGARFEQMSKHSMTNGSLPKYLEAVFPEPERGRLSDKNHEKIVAEVKSRRAACEKLAEVGRGNELPGIRGSLWTAYNGVTEWADHRMRFTSAHQRFNSLFFGEASRVKTRALSQALILIGDRDGAAQVASEDGASISSSS